MDLEAIAMRGILYSSKPQYYWSLTIRLFSVINRTLTGGGGGVFLSAEIQSGYSSFQSTGVSKIGFMLTRIMNNFVL